MGIAPNSALAADAGLEVGNGITVDEHLRTSDPDVFAAGDVADAYHPRLGRHIRVEHWANARRQGVTAARSMLGQDAVYDRLHYFFSDQFDLGMEYTGHVGPDGYDQVVFRGNPDKREFLAFWLAGGTVLAGMTANVWDVTEQIEALILSGRPVDAGRLADPDVPLDQLSSVHRPHCRRPISGLVDGSEICCPQRRKWSSGRRVEPGRIEHAFDDGGSGR